MSVTVYSKPSCVQCTATYKALERCGVPFEVVDLSIDQGAYDTILGMGYRQVPVVIAGEDHWAGFRPDKITALAGELVAA
ncbi:MAG TPA: NrdH-redoxin [Rhodospirillaceae bacterium]|nr:NrdH-redoxin [Rhodospirillaceae bacterium]